MWTEHSKSHASHHVVAWGLQAVEVNVSVLKGEFLVVPPLLVLRAGKERKWKNVSFQYFLERKRAKSCISSLLISIDKKCLINES